MKLDLETGCGNWLGKQEMTRCHLSNVTQPCLKKAHAHCLEKTRHDVTIDGSVIPTKTSWLDDFVSRLPRY